MSTRRRSLKDVFPMWFREWWNGRAKLTDPSEVNEPEGWPSASGYVTVDGALQLSAAWACIRLLAETISTLPCQMYERAVSGERRSASSHPLYELLHSQPNADMSAVAFWQAFVASMLTHGAAHVEKQIRGDQPVALDFLPPDRVRRLPRDTHGAQRWEFTGEDGVPRTIPESRMWYTPAFSLDGMTALSPIRYGAGVFGAALAADQTAARWFSNGMRPSGVLKTDKILTPKQRDDFRANIVNKFTGTVNTGGTLVLEAGLSYEQLSIPPEEAQLLQSRAFGIEEVCRWYGVPPILVGHSEKVTAWGTGIEQIVIGFLTFGLRPWLARIEQSIRRSLLAPAERSRYFAEFAVEGLLRADSAGRASFYSTMVQNGLMTRNEVRRLENLPRVDDGDLLTVQSNLVALSRLEAGGESNAAAALRNALQAFMHHAEMDDA